MFQLFFYERLIKNCCHRGPGGTFFGLACVSGVAIFALPIATQLVSNYFDIKDGGDGRRMGRSGSGNSNSTVVDYMMSSAMGEINGNTYIYSNTNSNNSYSTSNYNSTGDDRYSGDYSSDYRSSDYSSSYPSSDFYHSNAQFNALNNAKNMNLTEKFDVYATFNTLVPPSQYSAWVLYFVIVGCLAMYRASATSAFTTLGIVVNGSVERELRGKSVSLFVNQSI